MGSLMHARRTITPNGRFDLFAAPGFDPQQPDDVCKCYGSLPIFKPPFAQILGQPAAVPLLPLVRHLIFCLSTSFDAQVARSAANGGLSTQALVLS